MLRCKAPGPFDLLPRLQISLVPSPTWGIEAKKTEIIKAMRPSKTGLRIYATKIMKLLRLRFECD